MIRFQGNMQICRKRWLKATIVEKCHHIILHLDCSCPNTAARHRTSLPTWQYRSSTHHWLRWTSCRQLPREPSSEWGSFLPVDMRMSRWAWNTGGMEHKHRVTHIQEGERGWEKHSLRETLIQNTWMHAVEPKHHTHTRLVTKLQTDDIQTWSIRNIFCATNFFNINISF